MLIFFTPHANWWPQYLYRLNLLVINCCFTLHRTINERCKKMRAFLLQNLFRRHNFFVLRMSICRVPVAFIIASCLSPLFYCVRTPSVTVLSDAGGLQLDVPSYKHT